MRVSLPVSVVVHGTLILFGVIGLHGTQPLETSEVDAISVDLVPVTDQSSIQAGTEKSQLVKATTPSAVQTDKTPKIATRTGNTTKDQPQPLQSDKPSPKPTVQSAPAPSPAPAPENAQQPTTAPTPAPTPKPEVRQVSPKPQDTAPAPAPAPQPVLSASAETPAPEAVSPLPSSAASELAKRRAEFAKQQVASAKANKVTKQQQAPQAKPADKISSIINSENSRGATTGQGGQQTVGKPSGQAALLSQSERDALVKQMRSCWNVPLSAKDSPGLTAQLLVDLNQDGTVNGLPQILSPMTDPVQRALALSARRAVQECAPYTMLSAQKYAEWQQVQVTFDPKDAP